jgi:hypothetical protein
VTGFAAFATVTSTASASGELRSERGKGASSFQFGWVNARVGGKIPAAEAISTHEALA